MRKKQHFLQHKEWHKNTKETYIDGSKSIGGKVGFAAVLTDITRIGFLSEESSIHTAEITAVKVSLKGIHKIDGKRWIIYIDSQSSMQSMYDILLEL